MAKNVVVGIGNLLFRDDGVGVIVVAFLKKNFSFSPQVELLDGGTLGFNLIEYFLEYDNVLLVDAISLDDEPGEIYVIPSAELLGSGGYKKTAHEVEVVSMLEACELYEKRANVTVYGIVPKDAQSVEIGLSEVIENKFDILVENVIKGVKKLNVKVTKTNNFTLNEIIESVKRV